MGEKHKRDDDEREGQREDNAVTLEGVHWFIDKLDGVD